MTHLHVKIVTMRGVVYEGDAISVYLRSENGALGILPNRLPLIASLKKDGSVVRVNESEEKTRYFAVYGGALSHKKEETVILGEKCQEAESLPAAEEIVKNWQSKAA